MLTVLSRILFELRLERAHVLPRSGPAILVANHEGYLDPFFLQLATPRPVRYMVTSDFYDIEWIQPFFRAVGAIRVAEGGPHRSSLRTALNVLRANGLVGIFPEGQLTVDGEMNEAMPGAAFLAARSGAPVVPAKIDGSFEILSKVRKIPRQARLNIRFGTPMTIDDPRAGDRILEAVKDL